MAENDNDPPQHLFGLNPSAPEGLNPGELAIWHRQSSRGYAKVLAAGLCTQARVIAGIGMPELANRLGISEKEAEKLESADDLYAPTLATLINVMQVCGLRLQVSVVPIRPPTMQESVDAYRRITNALEAHFPDEKA